MENLDQIVILVAMTATWILMTWKKRNSWETMKLKKTKLKRGLN